MKRLLSIPVVTFISLISSISFASEGQLYVKAEVGAALLQKTRDKILDIKMTPLFGGDVNLGVGYYLTNNVRADLTFGFTNPRLEGSSTNTSTRTYNVLGVEKTIDAPITLKRTHRGQITSVLVNSYVDLNTDANSPSVFVGAGVGVAQIKEKITTGEVLGRDAPTAANFVPLQKHSSVTRKANNFAYQLIAGVSVSLNEKARIDVAYILADYGQTKFSKCNDVEINKTSYQTHNIIAGMRFDI
ncbi:MAG: outer membrane beta-barrel protein [Candidatus Tisiphia sp.]|nr:outer membrane beta-barrel protein [Candidatus Tisiphia sp.]